MTHRSRPTSPQLKALGPGVRILNAFIDALILGVDLNDAWNHPLVKTAILVERGDREGWNDTPAMRTLRGWGVLDWHGVLILAGLTLAETQVAELHFDRQMDSREIGTMLKRSPITVRVQLHKAREKLKRLAA